MTLSPEKIFARHFSLPQIGPEGQTALSWAHVVVVGVGAVGSRIAELLCRAGIGRLTLIDRDFVEFSNLPRQTLYTWSDAASSIPKVEAARRHLNSIMPACIVFPKHANLDACNASELLRPAHVVADGTDNLETRYVINDWCVKNGIPWVYAGASGTKASVFPVLPNGACLRCLFPHAPLPEEVPACESEGVLGSATALASALSSSLIIRIIVGDPPEQVWHTFDVWTGEHALIRFDKLEHFEQRPVCPVCRQPGGD